MVWLGVSCLGATQVKSKVKIDTFFLRYHPSKAVATETELELADMLYIESDGKRPGVFVLLESYRGYINN